MKKIIYIILVSFLSIAHYAQINPMELKDISLGKQEITVGYYEFPNEPLGEDIKTYDVTISTPSDWTHEMNEKALKSCFIEGMNKVDSNGDLSIVLDVKHFTFGKDTILTRENKNKNGQVIGHKHIIRVPYKAEYTVKLINNHTGKPLHDRTNKLNDTWSTKEIDELLHANSGNLNNARRGLPGELRKFVLEKSGTLVPNISWTASYGTKYIMGKTNYARIRDSKHYETYYFLMEIRKYDTNLFTPDGVDKRQVFIDYNLNLLEKYKNATPKVFTKIKAVSYYNLANIYYWEDDFDTARRYIAMGVETGELKSDFNRLSKDCDKYEQKLKLNNKTSRQQR